MKPTQKDTVSNCRRRSKSRLVAQDFGVSPKTIRDIWNRKTWIFATLDNSYSLRTEVSPASTQHSSSPNTLMLYIGRLPGIAKEGAHQDQGPGTTDLCRFGCAGSAPPKSPHAAHTIHLTPPRHPTPLASPPSSCIEECLQRRHCSASSRCSAGRRLPGPAGARPARSRSWTPSRRSPPRRGRPEPPLCRVPSRRRRPWTRSMRTGLRRA